MQSCSKSRVNHSSGRGPSKPPTSTFDPSSSALPSLASPSIQDALPFLIDLQILPNHPLLSPSKQTAHNKQNAQTMASTSSSALLRVARIKATSSSAAPVLGSVECSGEFRLQSHHLVFLHLHHVRPLSLSTGCHYSSHPHSRTRHHLKVRRRSWVSNPTHAMHPVPQCFTRSSTPIGSYEISAVPSIHSHATHVYS